METLSNELMLEVKKNVEKGDYVEAFLLLPENSREEAIKEAQENGTVHHVQDAMGKGESFKERFGPLILEALGLNQIEFASIPLAAYYFLVASFKIKEA